jgi:hypothetical protein
MIIESAKINANKFRWENTVGTAMASDLATVQVKSQFIGFMIGRTIKDCMLLARKRTKRSSSPEQCEAPKTKFMVGFLTPSIISSAW